MKNIERLSQDITKNGAKGILIHTIPGTNNWLICKKIGKNQWNLSIENPLGNTTYNLGTATTKQHTKLWMQLVNMEIEKKISQIMLIKKLKNNMQNLLNLYKTEYENIIKNFK